MNRTQFLVAFILTFQLAVGFAQQDYRRSGTNINYELDDWITYSATRWVTSLTEGREYIYFGTTGGIACYNFYANKWERPWSVSDGLSDNYILTVAFDFNTDYLWCSTQSGISLFRTTWKKWENVYYDEIGLYGSDKIVSIGFDNFDVWLNSRDGRFFKSSNQQLNFFEETGNNIPHDQILWSGEWAKKQNSLPELFMQGGYFFDQSGIIKDVRLDSYPVTCHASDHWNNIWVGTWGAGLGKADSRIKMLELIPDGLFIKNVNAFEIDDERNIWAGGIGSYNEQSGVTFWNIETNEINYYQARFDNKLYNDQVTSIAIDYPYVWFGTQYGLLRFNRDKNEWKTYDTSLGLRDNYVLDVEVDSNSVWIGTLLGLCRIEKNKMLDKKYRIKDVAEIDIKNLKVYDIEIMQNLLWIGTEYGVYVYDTAMNSGGFKDEADGPQNDEVTAVAVLGDKEVWFGMQDGIEVYDVREKKWRGAPERRFYNSTYVNYMVVNDSAAWIATDHGVLKYDKTRNLWRQFSVEDGLPDDFVNWIVLDGDYIWFGTSEGLTRFFWNTPYRID